MTKQKQEERFEKVVEYRDYDWQKRDYDIGDFLSMMLGFFFGMWALAIFYDRGILSIISAVGIILIILLYHNNIKLSECSNCGSKENLIKHHPDYSMPLKVVILCTRCHNRIHNSKGDSE